MSTDDVARLGKTVMRRTCIGVISALHTQPMTYTELWNSLGRNGRSNVFAYHLGKLREQSIITKDGQNYFLTFKGSKVYELIRAASEIASISIGSCTRSGMAREIRI